MSTIFNGNVVALAGGVGGARLVYGLDRALPAGALQVIVNTGDDFEHWGLHISPDLDTVMYTLANLSPENRGWGIDGDTFHALREARRRGLDDWFQLGDRDLVTHLERTAALARGASLTDVTQNLCRALDVDRPVLPMADAPRPTTIVTTEGTQLAFQEWLVRARGVPEVKAVRHGGDDKASPRALDALGKADLIVICPSNPYVSIDPILELEGVRQALEETPVVAVSPIIDGRAVKGPLAAMIPQLSGQAPSAKAVASHYGDLLDGYAVHPGDGFEAPYPVLQTNILIQAREDRVVFARKLLELAEGLE
jgi:LPPG:FO 2-phospho-L-lactate transferase